MKNPPLQNQTRKDGPPDGERQSQNRFGALRGVHPPDLSGEATGRPIECAEVGIDEIFFIDVRPLKCYTSVQLSRSTDQTET